MENFDWEQEKKDAYAEYEEWQQKVAKHNNRIFQAIEETLGKKYLEDIKECLTECEAHGELEIVGPPDEKYRQKEDWESFNHVYVDQYVNGGMEGDSFSGWLYIPLKKGRYLMTHYDM